jgi:hypothetical protein
MGLFIWLLLGFISAVFVYWLEYHSNGSVEIKILDVIMIIGITLMGGMVFIFIIIMLIVVSLCCGIYKAWLYLNDKYNFTLPDKLINFFKVVFKERTLFKYPND